jgi:cyclase
MLCKRVIPTMLIRGRTLVKGRQFAGDRSVGHAAQAARVNAMRGVDELCILDIAATAENRGPDLGLVHELSAGCFIPITVGGGVRTIPQIDELLRAGADRVAICTAAQEKPDLIRRASDRFGAQALVGCIDVRNGFASVRCGGVVLSADPVEWARKLADDGVGEILLTCVDRDGTMEGYDLELIQMVSEAVDIPVIASGGARDYEDMALAIRAGADAVAAGAMFQFSDATPRGAAEYLRSRGITARV